MASPVQQSHLERTDKLAHRLISVPIQVIVDAVDHLQGHGGVNEVGRADLYGRGACQKELHRVARVHDASQPDDGYFYRTRHLPHHTQGNGLYRRSPVTVESSGRRRSASMAIPNSVLINDTLSAPPASAARAISAMSVTLGDNFTIRVFL